MKHNNKGILMPILAFVGVIILVVAAYTFWQYKQGNISPYTPGYYGNTSEIAPEIKQLELQNTSDEEEAIEADLNNTDFTSIDSDLIEIETQLEASGE